MLGGGETRGELRQGPRRAARRQFYLDLSPRYSIVIPAEQGVPDQGLSSSTLMLVRFALESQCSAPSSSRCDTLL